MQEILKKLEGMGVCRSALAYLRNTEGTVEFLWDHAPDDWKFWLCDNLSESKACGEIGCEICGGQFTLNQILQCLECEWKS